MQGDMPDHLTLASVLSPHLSNIFAAGDVGMCSHFAVVLWLEATTVLPKALNPKQNPLTHSPKPCECFKTLKPATQSPKAFKPKPYSP